MKVSSGWDSKHRVRLGARRMTSMEDIRQQVSNLARCGLEQGTRSCTAERNAAATQAPDLTSKSRRGATDSSRS